MCELCVCVYVGMVYICMNVCRVWSRSGGSGRNCKFMGLTDHHGSLFPCRGVCLPALISGRFDLRIFARFIAPSILMSFPPLILSLPLLFVHLLLPLLPHRYPRCFTLPNIRSVQRPCPQEECSRYARTMGTTRGRIFGQELRVLLSGAAKRPYRNIRVPLNRKYLRVCCEHNDSSRRNEIIVTTIINM